MDDEISGNLLSTLENLAQTFVVALVLYKLFLIIGWPFMAVARLVVFILSFGKVKPSYKESFSNSYISLLAMLIFISVLGYLHLVYGSRLYGNLS